MGEHIQDVNNRSEIPKLQPLKKPFSVTAMSVLGLLLLALFYTLYFAREFFLPVTMGWILSLLLKPVVRILSRIGIPTPVGAAVVMLTLVSLFVSGVLLLSGPASEWLNRAPESLEKIESKVRTMLASAETITRAAETVEHIAEQTTDETPKVEIKKPGLLTTVWDQARGTLVIAVEVFVLLYFFLAIGDVFTLKLIQVLPRLREKKQALEIARETEAGVSQYLFSMTLVNLFEGIAIGIGMALLGMPNPVLWGVLAFFANYIPYLGAAAMAAVITIVAAVSFDSIGRVLLAPAIYFCVNFMDNFVSPYVIGHRLVLNPVIVFLAIIFWGLLWGIPGVLLAVPITVTIKIVCDHIAVLAPFAEFLTAPAKTDHAANGREPAAKGNTENVSASV